MSDKLKFFLVAALIPYIIKTLVQRNFSIKNKFSHVALLLLPLMIVGAGTSFYKLVNYKYFGVYEINTRTGGETGKFVNFYELPEMLLSKKIARVKIGQIICFGIQIVSVIQV